MKEEENVYEETTRAGQTATAEENVIEKDEAKEKGPLPEKFKDVDALARAYSALQAEFTRRSQRLKELERKMENFAKGTDGEGYSGVEKLRKNAQNRKAAAEEFADFLAETEKGTMKNTQMNADVAEPIREVGQPSINELPLTGNAENEATVYALNDEKAETAQGEKNGEEMAEKALRAEKGKEEEALQVEKAWKGEQALPSVAGGENAAISSEELYRQVCSDENVRLKIIGEYLSSLGKSGAPLMTGGVGVMATPPRKAGNIAEAGNMALLYLKKTAK